MISIELYRAGISGWGGHARYPLPQSHIRKSTLRIDLIWRISTPLQANTISALLMIGGIEINPGPGTTTEEEISFMEIEDCAQPDVFPLSSQTVQHTPISSQVVPLYDLDLFRQCSDVPMTPEKSSSTPQLKKRKGYRARKDRNRAAIKKRRFDDSEFCQTENEFRLERFSKECEDSDFQTKHNENQLRNITKKLKDPDVRAKHNKQQLDTMTERLKDADVRAKHNAAVAERLKDPDVHEKHNKHVLGKYRTNREEVSSVIQSHFSQISQGPRMFILVVDISISENSCVS